MCGIPVWFGIVMNQFSEIFKEGNLSPGVYSFTHMKGVTSTTLVDFSCRFTWSVTSFNGENKEKQQPLVLKPEVDSSPGSTALTPKRADCVWDEAVSTPFQQPYRNPVQSVCSPLNSAIVSAPCNRAIPPPLAHYPPCDNQLYVYPKIKPKTFSPVLIYQHPSLTSGTGLRPEGSGQGVTTGCPSLPTPSRVGLPTADYGAGFTSCVTPSTPARPSFTPDSSVNSWGNSSCVSAPREEVYPWCPSAATPLSSSHRPASCLSYLGGPSVGDFQAWRNSEPLRHGSSSSDPRGTLHIPELALREDSSQRKQDNPFSDSAKMRFFLDTKYGLCDPCDLPSCAEADTTFRSDPGFSLGPDLTLDPNFSDPLLDLLQEPLLSFQSEESEEAKRTRKYKCPYCHVSCANNGQLKGHLRVHTGERPYRCDYPSCGRAFARNEELTRHRRIHSGIRPHTCSRCGKKFGRKDHLNKHQKTHLKTAEKKVHVCRVPGCEQRYTRSDALARHQWGAHGIRSKPGKCRTQNQIRENMDNNT